jgi:hypothetical protein
MPASVVSYASGWYERASIEGRDRASAVELASTSQT